MFDFGLWPTIDFQFPTNPFKRKSLDTPLLHSCLWSRPATDESWDPVFGFHRGIYLPESKNRDCYFRISFLYQERERVLFHGVCHVATVAHNDQTRHWPFVFFMFILGLLWGRVWEGLAISKQCCEVPLNSPHWTSKWNWCDVKAL